MPQDIDVRSDTGGLGTVLFKLHAGTEVRVVDPGTTSSRRFGFERREGLKVQVAAPPVDGAANDELTRFLAKTLRLPRSAVHLIRGASSRRKTVAIEGLEAGEASSRLGVAGTT